MATEAKQVAHTPGRPEVWHPTLDIQINWTFEQDDTDVEIFCPGNSCPWRLGRIIGPTKQTALAYAKVITAATDLLMACEEVRKCGNGGAKLSRKASDMVRAALTKAGAA